MKQKKNMFIIDKLLFTTKSGIPVRFIFEIGTYIYECYDLYGRYPKYAFGFALVIEFKRTEKFGKYVFLKDYFGIII